MKKRIWGRFCDTSGESHKADQSPLIPEKIIPVSFMDHVRNLGQIFVSAITMGIILYVFLAMFNNLSYCIQLFLGLFIGLFSYLLLCKVFRVREVSVIMSKVRLYIHQN